MPPGATVLLVDDDDAVRAVTAELLRALGYRVVAVSGADEAIRRAAAGPVDALLVAAVLGAGGDGVALANRLRASRPDLAVVLMSGYPHAPTGAERLEGAAVLSKPFTLDALRVALGEPRPDALR